MTSKSQTGYAAVFAHMREHLSAYITPNLVMTNYDPEMQSALSLTFPEATIKGYWWQYTDVIFWIVFKIYIYIL